MHAHGNIRPVTRRLLPTGCNPVSKEIQVLDYFPGEYFSAYFADPAATVAFILFWSGQGQVVSFMPLLVASLALNGFS